MKQWFILLLLPMLLNTSCKKEEEEPSVSSTLLINNTVYKMVDAFITPFGKADSSSSSPYEGYKFLLDIYSQGVSYDKDKGFEGDGYVISIQLFSATANIQEAVYAYNRAQKFGTYDNCNIIQYTKNAAPQGVLLSNFGEITLKAFRFEQYTLTGTAFLNEKEVRFSYAGSLRAYP